MSSNPAGSIGFSRYLEAKKRLDDRSLNPRVWEAFRRELPRPADVLDLGCGLGVTLERLFDAGLLRPGLSASTAGVTRYSGIDTDASLIALAASMLSKRIGFVLRDHSVTEPDIQGVRFHGAAPSGGLEVSLLIMDLFQLACQCSEPRRWDVIVAHAFLDLVDLEAALNALTGLAAGGALLYASLCFDDLTLFEPTIDAILDDQIVATYHRHMYGQQWGGGDGHTRTGRRLLSALVQRGIEVLEAGPSDWVIVPRHGKYPDDERLVLQYLLTHLGRVVAASGEIPTATVQQWIEARLSQVDRGELVYVAHQLDVLARLPAQA